MTSKIHNFNTKMGAICWFVSPKSGNGEMVHQINPGIEAWLSKCCVLAMIYPMLNLPIWNDCKSQSIMSAISRQISSLLGQHSQTPVCPSAVRPGDPCGWASQWAMPPGGRVSDGNEKKCLFRCVNSQSFSSFKSSLQIPPAWTFRMITVSTSSGPGISLKHHRHFVEH